MASTIQKTQHLFWGDLVDDSKKKFLGAIQCGFQSEGKQETGRCNWKFATTIVHRACYSHQGQTAALETEGTFFISAGSFSEMNTDAYARQ